MGIALELHVEESLDLKSCQKLLLYATSLQEAHQPQVELVDQVVDRDAVEVHPSIANGDLPLVLEPLNALRGRGIPPPPPTPTTTKWWW